MFQREVFAAVRAASMAITVAAPALILPRVPSDSLQLTVLAAVFAGVFIYAEYRSVAPSMVEFREAPPFNRIRLVVLAACVVTTAWIARATMAPAAGGDAVLALGRLLGGALDFPFSPVRLMLLLVPPEAGPQTGFLMASLGLCYAISLAGILWFVVALRVLDWPLGRQGFNVWINLPLFDPTAGGDVLRRMRREASLNVALGFLLPFLIPAALQSVAPGWVLMNPAAPLTAIWVVVLWGFLPASLVMRGIALMRIASLIAEKRRRAYRHANLPAG